MMPGHMFPPRAPPKEMISPQVSYFFTCIHTHYPCLVMLKSKTIIVEELSITSTIQLAVLTTCTLYSG